ncbi:Benzil reductase ((S)-benzoin forming) [Jeotgalicoccus saudimassiliensis]|uniref:Benzil reductase ((S)-benzoin forming) n=1 Tax=Jeotgalicoccus saudimassiliensis TaxID=1461582 RepID=A0A078M6P9_9STAP|nr:SDR family NAD(P)-dependent oxidoreductase [Jeotgalicoccus saudimassiliensis]CEA01940.1 Benzil reductase ((S)-benzoin forming) [Jeotgalicoccus saudimassiliensis]
MKYVFLTGTNRGLGEAAAKTFGDSKIISITRSKVEEAGNIHKSFSVDFSDTDALEQFVPEIFNSVDPDETDEVYLLNVAGIVDPVKAVSNVSADDMVTNYKVNVVAPTLLIQGFVNRFKDFEGEKRIVTVTSGAARSAIEGWGVYCSSKAAVNMVHGVLNKENIHQGNNIKSAVFYPGVIDTGMQEVIRASDINEFPNLDRFKEYKDTNKLAKAEDVAAALHKVVTLEDFGSEESYDVKDYI